MKKVIGEIREFLEACPPGVSVGVYHTRQHWIDEFFIESQMTGIDVRGFVIEGDNQVRIAVFRLGENEDQSTVLFSMVGDTFPLEFYLEISRFFGKLGIQSINLVARAWDLIQKSEYTCNEDVVSLLGPERAVESAIKRMSNRIIRDHVACGRLSPLTRSDMAATGDAFVDMKDAYEFNRRPNDMGIPNELIDRSEVVWHTEEIEKMSDEEIRVAREAGCGTASPYVVPWAVCARAFGMKIFAMVGCTKNEE